MAEDCSGLMVEWWCEEVPMNIASAEDPHRAQPTTGGMVPLSNAAFPFGTWQTVDVGLARCRAGEWGEVR